MLFNFKLQETHSFGPRCRPLRNCSRIRRRFRLCAHRQQAVRTENEGERLHGLAYALRIHHLTVQYDGKRLHIDIYCLREAYRKGDLANLCRICTQHNISDALLNDKKSSTLHNVLKTHRRTPKVPFPARRTNAAFYIPFLNPITASYSASDNPSCSSCAYLLI